MEIIHQTATWSNAVLTALLPHFSDCAKQLNLPIPTPITISQVAHFVPPMETVEFQGALWLTNGYWFDYVNGGLAGFRSPDDWYALQDIDGLARYVGKDNMTTNEAIDLARNSFVKLGYKLSDFHMEAPPTEISAPIELKNAGHVPWCEVKWRSPEGETNALESYYLEFHLDMQHRRLAGMGLVGRKLWRPVPKIDATPELETDYQKKHPPGKMFTRTNAPPVYHRTNNLN